MATLFRALALGMIAAGCAASPPRQAPQQEHLTRAISPPRRLEPPDNLPENARAVLRTIMVSHASNMGDLMQAIMVLDYPRIREGADAIAGDASLARPLTQQATELNSLLPEEFFRQQDGLRAQARLLSDAASRQSPYGVAEAYGRLSENCVRCHYVYRHGSR